VTSAVHDRGWIRATKRTLVLAEAQESSRSIAPDPGLREKAFVIFLQENREIM
jgi:hypothetical protein